MRIFLIVTSVVLTLIAIAPYIVEILRGTTKPRIISWFTWGILTGIACVASFVDGQVPSAVLTLAAAIECMAIVVLGFKHGDRKFEKIDVWCFAGVVIGLVLWAVLRSPAIAVLVVVVIDLIGGIPTLRHSWQKPHEETWATFAISGAAALFTLLAADSYAITAIAYPLYIVVINVVFTTFILASPHRHTKTGPDELREF